MSVVLCGLNSTLVTVELTVSLIMLAEDGEAFVQHSRHAIDVLGGRIVVVAAIHGRCLL